MAILNKLAIVLLIAACVIVFSVDIANAVRVEQCDVVCAAHVVTERNECCKAHGFKGYRSCFNSKMVCYE